MRILSTVHPTENQKRVLAKIIASPNPDIAGHEVSGDVALVAARNMLMKLDMITYTDNEGAELTDKGQQIATEENLCDENGELTEVGKKLAYTNPKEEPDNDLTDQTQQQPPGGAMGMPQQPPMEPGMGTMTEPGMAGNELSIESFLILKELL